MFFGLTLFSPQDIGIFNNCSKDLSSLVEMPKRDQVPEHLADQQTETFSFHHLEFFFFKIPLIYQMIDF